MLSFFYNIFSQLYNASKHSISGIKFTYLHELAFRIEVMICLILLPIALLLGETWLQKALLIASLLFVVLVEILNSAIEATIDRISDAWHPLSKQAKDQGSAAVLIATLLALLVWCAVVMDRIMT